MRQMFEPFEKRARQEHSCPCCERSFTADEEASFIKKVTQSSPVFALTIQIIFCF